MPSTRIFIAKVVYMVLGSSSRRSDSGVRSEGRQREKSKEKKRERKRGGNACEICFQKVIPPTLSASNPNVVSGIKSCQSSNGRKTALFTEF